MPSILMLILHFLSAVTTDLPADVVYPVLGTALELTCIYGGSDFTASKWEWYKDNQVMPSKTAQKLTIEGATNSDDGSYHCIAEDAQQKKTAATPAKSVKFHSKYFLIHNLKDLKEVLMRIEDIIRM